MSTVPASLRDVNGDGVPDRLRYQDGVRLNAGALDPNAEAAPNLPSAVLPGLLLRATDPLGGVVEFTYLAAAQMKDSSGSSASPGFSLPKPVVSRVRHRDGRAGTPAVVTKLWYGGGAFDYAEKEFRGFETVITTQVEDGVDAAQTTSTYLTDRGCAFALATSETALGATILARESLTYQTVTGGGAVPDQWAKCLPATRVVESVEGSEATKKVSRTSWDFGTPIDANYNLQKLQEWGEWDPSTDENISGDERITEYAYATASASFPSIVSRLALETIKDASGNVYSKRRTCYGAACSDAGAGLVVSIRDTLTDYTADPLVIDVEKTVSTLAYDAFGNPTQALGASTADDADGLLTTITYDGTYQTFPTAIARGADVSSPLVTTLAYADCAGGLSPPPALGLPCSVTAPQGQADVLGYDSFGRVTRVERPASGYVETRSYTLPGASSPGQNVLETRIVRSGASDLVERQYMDGLSRVYRSESPGKELQTAIVDRTFDSRGRLRTESLPYFTGGGQLRTFSYDALGRPTGGLDPDGVTQRVQSYAPWTVIDETYFGVVSPGNRKERTERSSDGLGRLVRVAQFEDAVGAATPYLVTAKYDAADRLYEVRDPIGNDPSLCTSLAMGYACATQDHVTEIQWDTFGRRVKIDDPDSGVWIYRYDDAGLLKERTQNPGTGSARTQLYTYDELERPIAKAFTPSGNGVADASFVYDNASSSPEFGQLIEVNSSGGTSYLYGYDAAGRRDAILQRTAELEFGSAFAYDELDRVVHRVFPDGDAFDYGYDGTRLVEIRADPANAAFTGAVLKAASYDALGRMTSVEVGEGTGGATLAALAYTYDATHARLTRVVGTPANLLPNDPDGDRVDAASDSCPHAYNPDQLDAGGIGEASSPDGIGNACQCGDVDGTGSVTMDDGYAILTQGFSLSPLAMPDLCDVNGDGLCDPNDFFVLISRLSGGTEDLQVCPATLAGNVPSSAGLDLTVSFDGLGRLTSQTGQLAGEPVSRSYSYDGLSRLKTAVGPWEKRRGSESAVTWTYGYDALGNLRTQVSSRALAENGDHRTWTYAHPSKPHFLTVLTQEWGDSEEIGATLGGEAAWVDPGVAYNPELLVWNALGKLHRYKDSAYSYDAFGQRTLVVTGPSGSTASIVSVGEDFEYDIGASRANKHFSLSGVRIASLATSYVADSASVPPSLRIALRVAQPLAAPAASALLALGLVSLASLALRRRTPVWLAAPGVGVLSFALVALPYTAQAATLTVGAGRYGRHAEPILAYLVDHLGTVRAAVNRDGIVVETRDYAPFGESISHVGAFSVQHRFTGQPQDDQEGGLYDYGARFYNPKWGRFVSPDELVQGFDSQGLNPFAYVLNRPASATDPDGRLIWNGVSYGARSTDINGNVVGVGRGPGSHGLNVAAQVALASQQSVDELLGMIDLRGDGARSFSPRFSAIAWLAPAVAELIWFALGASLAYLLGQALANAPKDSGRTAPPQQQSEEDATGDDIEFTDHAEKQMGERGVSGQSVREAIDKGIQGEGNRPGRTTHDLPSGRSSTGRGVRVVTEKSGGKTTVVTVIDKGSRFLPGQ